MQLKGALCSFANYILIRREYLVTEKINISEFLLFPHQYCEYANSALEFLLQNHTVTR